MSSKFSVKMPHRKPPRKTNGKTKLKQKKHSKFREYKVVNVKYQVPSPTTINKKNDQTVKTKARTGDPVKKETQNLQETIDKYSPRIRELYVNPNKNRKDHCHIARKNKFSPENVPTVEDIQNYKSDPVIPSPDRTLEEYEETTNKIVSDAHRMIWLWLFNGLLPPNLCNKTVITDPDL